jgi:hypothetical protein
MTEKHKLSDEAISKVSNLMLEKHWGFHRSSSFWSHVMFMDDEQMFKTWEEWNKS